MVAFFTNGIVWLGTADRRPIPRARERRERSEVHLAGGCGCVGVHHDMAGMNRDV
jgi:hypothetical protein